MNKCNISDNRYFCRNFTEIENFNLKKSCIFNEFGYFWTHPWNSGFCSSKFRREIAIWMQKLRLFEWRCYSSLFKNYQNGDNVLLNFWILGCVKVYDSYRSRKMLKNQKWIFGCKNRCQYSRERASPHSTLFIYSFGSLVHLGSDSWSHFC